MLGKTIQNRYEIVKKIGDGGMAVVYKAKDTKLGRWVALKILRTEYSKDKNFILRFKNEARAYAALSHPNIINVYDIAEDNGLIFLALEYINAENLKDYLETKKVLEFNETLKIIKDVSSAIAYAHTKGIIHRDIKPSNVLIDDEGNIKVTDFGIARITQTETVTQGTMLGSVFYFSPEQAQGKEITPASDVYSLGVLAYQLLTGKLPFEGDNAVTVALKHVKETPPKPSEINPKLSTEIDDCILKALSKNPLDRYKNIDEFYTDFNRALEKLLTVKLENTIIKPALKLKDEEVKFEKRSERHDKKPSKKRNYIGLFIVLILLLAGAYFVINSLTEKVDVPNLVNMNYAEALTATENAGLKIKVQGEEFSDTVETGRIIKQYPEWGRKLNINTPVLVILSKGIAGLKVPNFIGKNIKDAETILNGMDLKFRVIKEVINKDVPEGIIIAQRPAPGEEIAQKDTVYFEVSQGAFAKAVPNLTDLTLEEAEKILKDFNLDYEIAGEKPSAKIPKGNVIDQDPKPKRAIPEDKKIKLYLSSGFENLTAPNLIGLGLNEAKQEVNELGLDLIIIENGDKINDNSQIIMQDPEVGALMKGNIVKVKLASTIVVPDLIGKSKDEAESLIKNAGFALGKVEYLKSSIAKSGTVIEQDPKSGMEVPAGQKIDLIVVK
ncbi:MAG: Stk1 family PASTA domain-containing Ser/Thr kinase [Armatimonadota bacterium]